MYEKTHVGVDAAILTIHESKLLVHLNKREKEPFCDSMELIGGLLKDDETASETLTRKMKQYLGDSSYHLQQFYTFTQPQRDPRHRTISIGFIALVPYTESLEWFEVNHLPQLAFDHADIITKACTFLKSNVHLVQQFLPESFPLNLLQEVYEVIEQKEYDNRNFRKRMLSMGMVEETGEKETNVSHRPAKLYRFAKNIP